MAKSLPLLGDNCAQVGIFVEDVASGRALPVLPCSSIIVYELGTFRSKCNYSWDDFYEWLRRICEDEVPQTLPCVKSSLSRLIKKRAELSRNKHHQQIADLFKEPFFPSLKQMNQKMEMAATEKLHLASRIEELREQCLMEVSNLEAKVHSLSSALDVAKTERDELADRLSQLESETVLTKQHSCI